VARPWQFWIDVGGTFTDCIGLSPDGQWRTHKLLSTGVYRGVVGPGSRRKVIVDRGRQSDPQGFFVGFHFRLLPRESSQTKDPRWRSGTVDIPVVSFDPDAAELHLATELPWDPLPGSPYELVAHQPAPVLGIRWLMGKRLHEPLGRVDVRLGTTRGTNALLERTGAPTAFVTTEGTGDALAIGYQNRPELFALCIRKPTPLYAEVVELRERLDAEGNILLPLDAAEVEEKLRLLKDRGIESLAVCLLHSHRNPVHEKLVGEVARRLGFQHISLSSELSRLPKFVSRGDTTVVDAYLSPVITDYVNEIQTHLPEATLRLMTSSGAVSRAEVVRGKDLILSGPAGGVVAAAFVAQSAGFDRVIGFDMGGTSTDVSRFDGHFQRRYEMELTDPQRRTSVRIVAPMLEIETVAAGGGSICWFDGLKPCVGPRSAGADPGPACYGKGGPLCLTDVNLFLGRLLPQFFPFPLDRAAVVARLDALIEEIEQATGARYRREELAEGFLQIANANMAAAIKKISVAKGYDVRQYALVSFGGAGSQHACAVAESLGIRQIVCSPLAGLLSALGIGIADVTKFADLSVGRPYRELMDVQGRPGQTLRTIFEELEEQVARRLREEQLPEGLWTPPRRLLELRYRGQEATLVVAEPPDGCYDREFARLHQQQYGFTFPDREVEVYAARVERSIRGPRPPLPRQPASARSPAPETYTEAYFRGTWHHTPVFLRSHLRPGDFFSGPAIVIEPTATVVVEPGWGARVDEQGYLVLTHAAPAASPVEPKPGELQRPDPVRLELFAHHFMAIAEQMGAALQKTAISTNVKERLDFSCAIFSADGSLVAHAPHIPVHLGAMSECVRCLMEDVGLFEPGDVYVTNDPFRGGSHLPDVTVISPVFVPQAPGQRPELAFFVASRAHHAEIGGLTPGSMPPFSTRLIEEGVVLRAYRCVRQGHLEEEELRRLLTAGPYPSRRPDDNLADLKAQIAANQTGAQLLLELVRHYGRELVHAYMGHLQNAAARAMRRALARWPEGVYEFTDSMDDGWPIRVRLAIQKTGPDEAEATLDFSGTGPVHPGNLNANRAITTSCILYCFRCLIDDPIPLNSGVLAPLRLNIPLGTFLNPVAEGLPEELPAVSGGNVETSQRIVDVLFGALGVVAASQGTMNNVLLGMTWKGQPLTYYETLAGGAGAGPGFPGADAVHTHMTNTRITDVETVEARYPVRIRCFKVRGSSGGQGQYPGGNGLIREYEFLVPAEVSLLTSRRLTRPYGLQGGEPGAPGRNLVRRRGQLEWEELPPLAHRRVEPGDILRVETPGGGGFGPRNP
jgi:5-oxoprolinase (ATP-hydrolysing)